MSNENIYFNPIYVVKRNGHKEQADFSKVDYRLNFLNSRPYQLKCNASFVAQKVRDEITDGIETRHLDEYAAKVAADLGSYNHEYLILAERIAASNHQKNTSDCFSDCVEACYRNRKPNGKPSPRVNAKLAKFVQCHKQQLNAMIDYDRDFNLTYFGFTTLIDRYLIKKSGPRKQVELRPQDYALERPQDMWMRVACAIHMNRSDLEDESVLADVQETYELLSTGKIMHATPTLYNAGTECEQFLSCFLLGGEDSIKGIFKLVSDSAEISKYSGGVGFWWDLRSSGSEVQTTNGISNGPIPFLAVQAAGMEAVDQGGKRPGSAANFIEPTHPDFMHWVKLRRQGEVDKIDTLYYAVWASDVFMEAVRDDEWWYFVDPHDNPELYNMYGAEYRKEYQRIIDAKEYVGEPIRARKVMTAICHTQSETGLPYMCFKDSTNEKSNQKNIGIIKSSNLCCEIMEVSTPEEYACCSVAHVCLTKFVIPCDCEPSENDIVEKHVLGCTGISRVDYDDIAYCAGVLVRNLNKTIDANFYPVPETRKSNFKHRPLAIGVQGLADEFMLLRMPFTSIDARAENKRTFESLYYGALRASCDLAKIDGPYETFEGSPFSQGILQFDYWKQPDGSPIQTMGKWNWDELREDIKHYGTRNSLLTSLPPTASTSHIQGNNECLDGATPIMMSNGLSTTIESFDTNNTTVLGWNNAIEPSNQSNKIDQGIKDTIELEFFDGRKIICTPNHKFLTTSGEWMEAKDIKLNETKIINGISGAIDINYGDETDYTLVTDGMTLSMDTKENRYNMLAYARILGYILSDGTIGKHVSKNQYQIRICMGTQMDADAISKDIKLLEGKLPRIKDTERTFNVILHSKLTRSIASLNGIVIGKRSSQKSSLPLFLIDNKCPKSVVREFLAGFMGGDGCLPFLSKNSTFRGIKLELSSHKDHLESLRNMFNIIILLFEKLGITGTEISGPFKKSESNILGNVDNLKLRLTFPINTDFANKIGLRYCVNKLCRLSVINSYWNYKETIFNTRKQIVNNVLRNTEKISIPSKLQKAHQKILGGSDHPNKFNYVSSSDIKYYKKVGGYTFSNRNKCGFTPSEYLEHIDCLDWFKNVYAVSRTSMVIPHFSMTVNTSKSAGMRQVWDISVDKTNSFLANGIMVHNCFEPYSDNLYVRKTLSGDNLVINPHLMKDFVANNLWTPELKTKFIEARGSVQSLNIPQWMKDLYLTVWEMDGTILVEMDAERAPFVDQSMSSNRFMANPSLKNLMAMHHQTWSLGLKTGMYYLRMQSKSKAKQFSEAAKARKAAKPIVNSDPETKTEDLAAQVLEEMTCEMKIQNGVTCYSCQ